ncbi:DoxX family protein [Alcanivorax sp.]|uniref:DoxX family protein n=1 Tax=Alcanivorax sp. TaxID=1872427 RepID=UPI0025B83096|nr:DoxX family protein [Alcanivorax sp.]
MNNPDLAKLILRLTAGILMLLHGIGKLYSGVGWIAQELASHNLPGFLAYGVFIGELVAPIMVIIGLHTRVGAVLMAGNMLVAIVLVHMGQIFSLTSNGGWTLELQGVFLFTSIAIFFLGAGRYAVRN